jgi:tRNA(fMet)-specific endonuclease VapC
MPQPAVLLDTDILSELLKQHPFVLQRVRTYLAEHERLAFSIITRYELLRGLKAKQARTQEAAFTLLCQASLILPLTDQVVDRAATLLWRTPSAGCPAPRCGSAHCHDGAGIPAHIDHQQPRSLSARTQFSHRDLEAVTRATPACPMRT